MYEIFFTYFITSFTLVLSDSLIYIPPSNKELLCEKYFNESKLLPDVYLVADLSYYLNKPYYISPSKFKFATCYSNYPNYCDPFVVNETLDDDCELKANILKCKLSTDETLAYNLVYNRSEVLEPKLSYDTSAKCNCYDYKGINNVTTEYNFSDESVTIRLSKIDSQLIYNARIHAVNYSQKVDEFFIINGLQQEVTLQNLDICNPYNISIDVQSECINHKITDRIIQFPIPIPSLLYNPHFVSCIYNKTNLIIQFNDTVNANSTYICIGNSSYNTFTFEAIKDVIFVNIGDFMYKNNMSVTVGSYTEQCYTNSYKPNRFNCNAEVKAASKPIASSKDNNNNIIIYIAVGFLLSVVVIPLVLYLIKLKISSPTASNPEIIPNGYLDGGDPDIIDVRNEETTAEVENHQYEEIGSGLYNRLNPVNYMQEEVGTNEAVISLPLANSIETDAYV